MPTATAPASDDLAIERLTFDPGITNAPSLSSDGRLLAYASDRSGRGDLDSWVQQTGGGTPPRITDDAADDLDPDLSADGSRIVFRSERNGGGAYLRPLGGAARLIAAEGQRPVFRPTARASRAGRASGAEDSPARRRPSSSCLWRAARPCAFCRDSRSRRIRSGRRTVGRCSCSDIEILRRRSVNRMTGGSFRWTGGRRPGPPSSSDPI
jgi:hypothetical protein